MATQTVLPRPFYDCTPLPRRSPTKRTWLARLPRFIFTAVSWTSGWMDPAEGDPYRRFITLTLQHNGRDIVVTMSSRDARKVSEALARAAAEVEHHNGVHDNGRFLDLEHQLS